jgi:hypothetical protein
MPASQATLCSVIAAKAAASTYDSATRAAVCLVTATKAADSTYASMTSPALQFKFNAA